MFVACCVSCMGRRCFAGFISTFVGCCRAFNLPPIGLGGLAGVGPLGLAGSLM